MKTYTIKMDRNEEEKWLNFLESLSYEVNSRQSLIHFLVNQTNTEESQNFLKQYINEYQDFYIQYENAKRKFEKEYVLVQCPKTHKWYLDFYYKTLTIEADEKE